MMMMQTRVTISRCCLFASFSDQSPHTLQSVPSSRMLCSEEHVIVWQHATALVSDLIDSQPSARGCSWRPKCIA